MGSEGEEAVASRTARDIGEPYEAERRQHHAAHRPFPVAVRALCHGAY